MIIRGELIHPKSTPLSGLYRFLFSIWVGREKALITSSGKRFFPPYIHLGEHKLKVKLPVDGLKVFLPALWDF